MRYFFTLLRVTFLQQLRSLRNWIILLLLPAIILSAKTLLPESEATSPISVGVVLPVSGGEEMWQLLEARNDSLLTFILTDANTLDRNIASGRWDCGIILAEDFHNRVSELDTDRIFTLRIGPGSTVYPLVKETVTACFAQLIGPHIARDYLQESGIAEGLIEINLDNPDRVQVSLTTLDGQPLRTPELATRGTRNLLRWLVCVSILVRMLFSSADSGIWIQSPGMKRSQPLRASLCTMAARGTVDAILLVCSGSAAMLLLEEAFWGCVAVLCYVLFWLMISLLLAQFPSMTTVLHVLAPFAVVINLLLSSVLLDISLIFPKLSGISRWLPVSMFLEICKGDLNAAWLLLTGSFLGLMLAWSASQIKKQS